MKDASKGKKGINVIECGFERVMVRISTKEGRNLKFFPTSTIEDEETLPHMPSKISAAHVKRSNDNHWTNAVSDWSDYALSNAPQEVAPARWSDLFQKSFTEKFYALQGPHGKRIHRATLMGIPGRWKYSWCPLEQVDDHNRSTGR
ncbi:hypothetical protein RB195_015944 [Necator americanus]|uniref:Uncharacterized protein n=1 Tax=Necator americanus TaxID=51031 RepID=A0ABR1E6W1_NECAM